jgi:hypothetical protein
MTDEVYRNSCRCSDCKADIPGLLPEYYMVTVEAWDEANGFNLKKKIRGYHLRSPSEHACKTLKRGETE